MSEFRKGQQVMAKGKRGIVLETYTSGTFEYNGEEYNANRGEKYVVAHEDGTDVFVGSSLRTSDWRQAVHADPDAAKAAKTNSYPAEKVNAMAGRKFGMRTNALGFDAWPSSWEDAQTPARLIALDAWFSMGGTFDACHRELKSNRLCAAFKDEIYQTTEWR